MPKSPSKTRFMPPDLKSFRPEKAFSGHWPKREAWLTFATLEKTTSTRRLSSIACTCERGGRHPTRITDEVERRGCTCCVRQMHSSWAWQLHVAGTTPQ